MKRTRDRMADRRTAQRTKSPVPSIPIDEGLSLIQKTSEKLIEFRNSAKHLAETVASSSPTSDAAKSITNKAEEILGALEKPLEQIFQIEAALTQTSGGSEDDKMNPADALDFAPKLGDSENEEEKLFPSSESVHFEGCHRRSDPDLTLLRKERVRAAKARLFRNLAADEMHNNDIRTLTSRIAEITGVRCSFQTAFCTDTISVSLAQFVCARHESFTVYIELNSNGTATPKRVYVQSPFSYPKSRKTAGVHPLIYSRPPTKLYQDMETLLNEAMEWYWQKELEKYIRLTTDKREKSVPGLAVLERLLLYALCFKTLLQKLPQITNSAKYGDPRIPLEEIYCQEYKKTKDEMISSFANRA